MRQVSIKDLEKNPESFMISTTWCPPCKQMKQIHKASDFAYLNYDEVFENGKFKTLDKKDQNLEVQHYLNTIGIKFSHFPTFVEYKDGVYSIYNRYNQKELMYKDLIEEAEVV